ncbi:MAG: Uma2 family endonuclease [Sporichthyaceae bacterium]
MGGTDVIQHNAGEYEIQVPHAVFFRENWTEEEYFALPDPYFRRTELLDGQLLVSPLAAVGHQRIAGRLSWALGDLAPREFEALPSVNVHLASGRILIPDGCIAMGQFGDGLAIPASDLAVVIEIASPSTVRIDRLVKPKLYAEAGIPIYIRIERDGPRAIVGRLVGDRYVWSEPDSILRLEYPFPVEIDLPALIAPPTAAT